MDEELKLFQIDSYSRTEKYDHKKFTVEGIKKICLSLKSKKAPGHDGITSEYFRYAGNNFLSTLTNLYNRISVLENVPGHFNIGVLVSIPKGEKDKCIRDNYRGITLLQTIRKIYEKAMLPETNEWITDKYVIDNLQGANQPHCSSIQTNWTIRETIAHYEERAQTVYVCLLDAKKAFDSVWLNGLFYKMYKQGMNGKTWRILQQLYTNCICCVVAGNCASRWFGSEQGILQGAPYSMLKYQLNNNELIVLLKKSPDKLMLGKTNVSCPTFADDMTVMSLSKVSLQRQLDRVYSYSSKWRYLYNSQKCKVIIFGKDKSPSKMLMLGNNHIDVVDGHDHVGTMLGSNDKVVTDYIRKRATVCKRPGHAIMGIGSQHAPVTPITASKLYWSVCVPRLCYGIEMMAINGEAMDIMEAYHAEMAKTIQSLPVKSSNIGSCATAGWLPMTLYVDMLSLMSLWRIMLMPSSCIYKQILLFRYCCYALQAGVHRGPLSNMLTICSRYKLMDLVESALKGDIPVTKSRWARIVKCKIWDKANLMYKVSLPLYKSLSNIRSSVATVRPHAWWMFAYNNPQYTRICRIVCMG